MPLKFYYLCTLICAALIATFAYALASFGSCMTATGHCTGTSLLAQWLQPFLIIIAASAVNLFLIKKARRAKPWLALILPCVEYFFGFLLYYLFEPDFQIDTASRLDVLWHELGLISILGTPVYLLAVTQAYAVYKADKQAAIQANDGE